ncbi:hypothetical protein [Shewanella sp. NIFS-20-20]|uniref:hypothetical protein n=1 Tax=Shewanella sp. NIFS-20-20 TaxID=2853806 RepID=UPI001C4441D1|nr:hypothetical protein [Shewanella sp. NIFS-20-20]MBV7317484.1 hypothetical protein [Shewanella sp. NIFS-20-20]
MKKRFMLVLFSAICFNSNASLFPPTPEDEILDSEREFCESKFDAYEHNRKCSQYYKYGSKTVYAGDNIEYSYNVQFILKNDILSSVKRFSINAINYTGNNIPNTGTSTHILVVRDSIEKFSNSLINGMFKDQHGNSSRPIFITNLNKPQWDAKADKAIDALGTIANLTSTFFGVSALLEGVFDQGPTIIIAYLDIETNTIKLYDYNTENHDAKLLTSIDQNQKTINIQGASKYISIIGALHRIKTQTGSSCIVIQSSKPVDCPIGSGTDECYVVTASVTCG